MKEQHPHKVHKTDIKQEKKNTDNSITWVILIVSFNNQYASSQSPFSEILQKKMPTEIKEKQLKARLLSSKI